MRAAVCVVLCGVCGVVWYVWYVRRVWRVHISISKILWTNKERNEETSCVRDVTTSTPARQPFNTIAIVNLSKQVHNTPHNTSNTTTTTNPPTHHRTSVHDTPQHQHIHLHNTMSHRKSAWIWSSIAIVSAQRTSLKVRHNALGSAGSTMPPAPPATTATVKRLQQGRAAVADT